MKIKNNQHGFGTIIVVSMITLIIGAVGLTAYKTGQSSSKKQENSSTQQVADTLDKKEPASGVSQSEAAPVPKSDEEQIAAYIQAA